MVYKHISPVGHAGVYADPVVDHLAGRADSLVPLPVPAGQAAPPLYRVLPHGFRIRDFAGCQLLFQERDIQNFGKLALVVLIIWD